MKKTTYTSLATLVLSALVLTACGQKVDQTVPTPASSAQVTKQVAKTATSSSAKKLTSSSAKQAVPSQPSQSTAPVASSVAETSEASSAPVPETSNSQVSETPLASSAIAPETVPSSQAVAEAPVVSQEVTPEATMPELVKIPSTVDSLAISQGDFSSLVGTWFDGYGNSLTFDASGLISLTYNGVTSTGISLSNLYANPETGVVSSAYFDATLGSGAGLIVVPSGMIFDSNAPVDTRDYIQIGQSSATTPESRFYRG